MPLRSLVLLAGLALSAVRADAQEVLNDSYGDPLPPGAFARIGNTRFRIGWQPSGLRFLDGGKMLLVRTDFPSFGPTGTITRQPDGFFHLFDAQSGRPIHQQFATLNERPGDASISVEAASWCVSPDGKYLAVSHLPTSNSVGSSTGRFRVVDLTTGMVLFEVDDSSAAFASFQFSSDGEILAAFRTGKKDTGQVGDKTNSQIQLWRVANGKTLRTLNGPPFKKASWAPILTFSPDGRFLAADLSSDGTHLWDVAGIKGSWPVEGLAQDGNKLGSVAFSPDGKTLTGWSSGKVCFWDIATGRQTQVLDDFPSPCVVEFSPLGDLLVAVAREPAEKSMLRIWDSATGKQVSPDLAGVEAFTFSADGSTLAVADAAGKISVRELKTRKSRVILDAIKIVRLGPTRTWRNARLGLGATLALSPDGGVLAVGEGAGLIRRWDTKTGSQIHTAEESTASVSALAFSHDGKELLVSEENRLKLLHLKSAQPPVVLQIPKKLAKQDGWSGDRVNTIHMMSVFTADSKRLAGLTPDGQIAMWDTSTGRCLWQEAGDATSRSSSLELIANDQSIVTASLGGKVTWRDANTGKVQRVFDVPIKKDQSKLNMTFLAPGAQTALVTDWGGPVQEWELTSGKLRREAPLDCFFKCFAPNGRSWLGYSSAGHYSLLNTATWQEIRVFSSPATSMWGFLTSEAKISADGTTLAANVGTNKVRVWDFQSGTVLREAQSQDGDIEPMPIAISSDGSMLATSTTAGTVLLWRGATDPPAIAEKFKAKATGDSSLPDNANDADGLPLPSGARHRLGSQRFQVGGNVGWLRYLPGDRKILAAVEIGGRDAIQLWDAESGHLTWTILSRGSSFLDTRNTLKAGEELLGEHWTLSPDGKWLATWDFDQGRNLSTKAAAVRIIDVATGRVCSAFDVDEGKLDDRSTSFAFAKDGKSLNVVAENPRLVRCFNFLTGKELKQDPVQAGGPFAPANAEPLGIRKNDRDSVIATGSKYMAQIVLSVPEAQPRLKLFEVATGKCVHDFGPTAAELHHLVFSPNDKLLAGLDKKKAYRWDVANRRALPPLALGDLPNVAGKSGAMNAEDWMLQAAAFSPDGEMLGVAHGKSIMLFDSATGELRASIREAVGDQYQPSNGMHVGSDAGLQNRFAFSDDGKTLVAADGRCLRIFDVCTGTEIGPKPDTSIIHSITTTMPQSAFAVSCSAAEAKVWHVPSRTLALSIPAWLDSNMKEVELTCIALTPDGRYLAVGASDGEIAIVDVASGKRRYRLRFHQKTVQDVAFADGGSTLQSTDLQTVGIWQMSTGTLVRQIVPNPRPKEASKKMPQAGVEAADLPSFFPGYEARLLPGKNVLLGVDGEALTVWGLPGGKQRISVNRGGVSGPIGISPNGKTLAFSFHLGLHRDGIPFQDTIDLVDAAAGQPRRSLGGLGIFCAFCFSPDSKLVAGCSAGQVRIWDADTGTVLADLGGQRGVRSAAGFSRDGQLLITAALDGSIVVWDVATVLQTKLGKPWSGAEASAQWIDLGSEEGLVAGKAMRALLENPNQALAVLRKNLKPTLAPQAAQVKAWIRDLDDSQFQKREQAALELKKLAELAEPALKACLEEKPPLEVQRRVQRLLDQLFEPLTDLNKLRSLRAIEVLQQIANSDAQACLEVIAGGTEQAWATRAARDALQRAFRRGRSPD
jgi:WD40 repeat protein